MIDLKRLKELAERAPQVEWETNPDVENSDGISLYFNNPYAKGQREIIAAVYWPCHGQETLAEIEHKWPAITMMFALLSPPKVRELVADLEAAVKYLREGKAKFAPNTDNSFVDDFLKKYESV